MTSSFASSVLAGVADAALRAIVFAGVMGLALAVCRVKGAAARLWAWTIVLGVAFSLPLLGRAVPGLRWTLPAFAPLERLLGAASSAAPAGGDVLSSGSVSTAALLNAADASQSTSLYDTFRATWPVWLLGVYLTGVLVLLLRAAMSWRATRILERDARVIDDQGALDHLQRHAAIAGLARAPVLAEASALSVPVTMSVMRPMIVLPRRWREWSAATLNAVLAHEVAHVARRDTLTQRVSLVYRAVAWFSPLSWWLQHRLSDLAEQASDDAALASGADRTEYAETLLAFFTALKPAPRRAEWHVAMARGAVVSAERRMELILAWKGDRSMRLTRRFVLGVLLSAAPVAVITAAVHPVVAPPVVPAHAAAPQGGTPDPIYKPGNGVTDPVPLRQQEPKYTSQAMRQQIEGVVLLEAVILPNGTVGDVRVAESLDAVYGLDQEAIKAAKTWLFKPSTKNGQPVAVRVNMELSFRLKPRVPPIAQTVPTGRARGGGAGPVPGAGTTTRVYTSEEMRQRILAAVQPAVDEFAKGAYPEDKADLVAPKPTYSPEPKYTSDALRAKIQGEVIIEVVVGADGLVSRARVAQSLDKDYGLDDEALKAAKQWRFEPGTLNGERVPVLVKLELSFRIH